MPVLVIGATGVLGRPVVRRLVQEGLSVRALVRRPEAARRLLPASVDIVRGDLREPATVGAALEGMDAVHISVAHPFPERTPFDPDLHGTETVVDAAVRAGVGRIIRLSALGVPDPGEPAAADGWWVIERKRAADALVLASDVPATVFRGDWFMESLAVFALGPLLLVPAAPPDPLRWIAGDDFGRMVARALKAGSGADGVFPLQGPEPVGFAAALARFRRAAPRRLVPVSIPALSLRVGGRLSPKARYLADLLRHTYAHTLGFTAQATWDAFGMPHTTIEAYADSIRRTRDWPRKR